jgi:tetratricopeptide (TPR) repeat protein
MSNPIFIVEDHDKVLEIWRKKNIKGLDLIHLDAHIDFGFYQAKPKEQAVKEAQSLNQLKQELEKSILYQRYQRDFAKQTNIGNYIYQAMCEGIVRDFYWVVPGGLKEFKKARKLIKSILKHYSRQDPYRSGYRLQAKGYRLKDGIISTKLFRRKFVICVLEKLPILKQKVLLDIDTDFLIVDSLLNANNTAKIGKRKPWIRPDRLVKDLLSKELKPVFTTIAYSVNGGYTPMRYRVLGDELAYRLSPLKFKQRFAKRHRASIFFDLFELTGKKEYYQKAVRLNPCYRAANNNYGALYLSIRRFSKAQKEFLRIARVDLKNPYPFAGLGEVCLQRKDYCQARQYFSYALRHKKDLPSVLLGLAEAEFGLKNFKKAKFLFHRYQALEPLQPQSYYYLGRIHEKEKNFEEAAVQYQDAMGLGLKNIDVLFRLLKISCHLKAKDGIINFIIMKYKELKKEFAGTKRLSLKKKNREIKGLPRFEKKMAALERRLREFSRDDN